MKYLILVGISAVIFMEACTFEKKAENSNIAKSFDSLALTPPLGWNSWDCLGLDANEEQIRAVADYMAEHLKKFGWEYVVIDAGWYHPKELVTANSQTYNPKQNIDGFGRLIPDTIKYPSSKSGAGFKVLADYIHSKGLKFGIHVMRGIPWNAISNDSPIKNTEFTATQIADLTDTCAWSPIMKGVNTKAAGAQEYYNSVFDLYAEWGVDFVKVDDMSKPFHGDEIIAVQNAILQCGYPIVFSLSPGPAPVNEFAQLSENSHMWRISGDFWDDWKWLKLQFENCSKWDSLVSPGHWPDADMLPIGKLRKTGGDAWIASQLGGTIEEVTNEFSRFSDTEKYTLFTLYSIFKSPLMIGGYLPENDSVTYNIITNDEVIAINQKSENSHELRNDKGIIVWTADDPITKAKYVAFFNINDGQPLKSSINWNELGFEGEMKVRDLWAKKDIGTYSTEFSVEIEAHGCKLISFRK